MLRCVHVHVCVVSVHHATRVRRRSNDAAAATTHDDEPCWPGWLTGKPLVVVGHSVNANRSSMQEPKPLRFNS